MSRSTIGKQFILNAVSRITANFTAAVTNIITSASHGLSTGDRVELTTTDTLPAGLELNTVYFIMVIDANTFKLSATKPIDNKGGAVDITDTGTGTHTFTVADTGNPILVKNFRHKKVTISTDGMGTGDTTVVKCQGGSGDTPPDFHLASGTDNDWDYLQMIDREDGSTVDGDVGITITAADDKRKLAINDDTAEWINFQITTQSDVTNTSVTASIVLANDSNI
jgi:hypothetical protein